MPALPRLIALPALLLCAVACSKPEPPPTDQPPEPQAQAQAQEATQLRDAIQRPLDKARAVEPQVLEAARRQQAAIEAQSGG